MENSSKLSIPDFYNGKSVLLTGGFGFLGKVIIEKLLRSCPGIENIFLLARSKKGKNVQERLDEIINTPPFANLKEKSPEVFKKIVLIEGDVAEENLGISETDQKLICDKVSIFIHNAATINFNEPLKTAVDTNLRSVREMINLAKKAKNLDALVHVSSAFTNWFESDNDKILVEEKIYPNPYNPDDIIKITQLMPDDVLNKITPSLLGKHTNTYSFTKNLAEHLIVNEGKDMPIAIIRPSMVIGSAKEPMPGWLDSWVGPTTYAYLIARGLLRSWHVHKNNVGEVIPVDMTVNLIIASAWKVGIEKNLIEPQIYHSVTGANPITWEKMFKQYLANAKKYPLGKNYLKGLKPFYKFQNRLNSK
ncbi:hypothetical protein PVAND_017653 [Polypedilum vanderplanki]|uniref:Fatty acyl-CoA reductase n=1 Tax=Polypedilum vanderplanki TaxID=319348 RepID=A0A9J6B8Y0_POLVA|nr:hypothetical protein PVAND_017653 [Polypedilum vanderplanki]